MRIKIEYNDVSGSSPRDWDNLGTMVCKHSRYDLGDSNADGLDTAILDDADMISIYNELSQHDRDTLDENAEEWGCSIADAVRDDYLDCLDDEDWPEIVWQCFHNHAVILPLYLYDHSGITMNTTGFSCGWDSGMVGYIFVTHDAIKEEYGSLEDADIELAKDILRSEVKAYDAYIRGSRYGFVIEDDDGEHVDSCWGFLVIDFNFEECGILDHLDKCAWEAAHEAYENIGEWVEYEAGLQTN